MKVFRTANRAIKMYSSRTAKQVAKERKKAENELYKQLWEKERKHYYEEARNIFNKLCHQGKIKKRQQEALRHLLERRIAGYMKDYKKMQFDNEFHRIYTYLKCYHLNKSDWEEILEYLYEIQKSS